MRQGANRYLQSQHSTAYPACHPLCSQDNIATMLELTPFSDPTMLDLTPFHLISEEVRGAHPTWLPAWLPGWLRLLQ